MSDQSCPQGFDEKLISGYLDDELNQARAQRVEVHVQDCETCGRILADLEKIREVAMSTTFTEPQENEWDEMPKGTASKTARGAGWILIVVWFIIMVGFGLWQFAISPEALWLKIITFGGILGFLFLLVSVLIDRIRVYRTDPYREVDK